MNFTTVEIRSIHRKRFVSIILNNGRMKFIESSLNMIQFPSVTHRYIEFRASISTNIITIRLIKRFMRWTNLSVSQNIGIWESVQNTAEWHVNIYERKCVLTG